MSIYHERHRKKPWLVVWWGKPDFDTGKQKRHTRTFQYRRDALEFRAVKQEELRRDGTNLQYEDVTLVRLINEFQEARLQHLSHSAQRSYTNTLSQLREHLGDDVLIRSVDQRQAERFIAGRTRRDGSRGKLSTWSIATHVKHCRALFGAAVDWGYLAKNPFIPPKHRHSSPLRCRPKSRPWHHLTPAEFKQLLGATPSVRRRAMYWLMYGAGLRPGEVYNMTADRIDLRAGRVRVESRQATPDVPPFVVKADTQSADEKRRTVPVPQAAAPDLLGAIQQALRSSGFISLTEGRFKLVQSYWRRCAQGEPWGQMPTWRPWQNCDMLNNALRDARCDIRRAGLTLTAPFTLHTFRKSFAQNHADAGTHPRTLSMLLGHADVRLTLEFYQRVTDANERAAAATTDGFFR